MDKGWYHITEEDIQRVPRARIFGDKRDKFIQDTCKLVLRESMNRKDGYKDDEIGIFVDIHGNRSKLLLGKEGRIDIDNEYYMDIILSNADRSLIFVHNHPNNSHLSYNDICELIGTPSILAVVAIGNNGNVNYCLKLGRDDNYYNRLSLAIMRKSDRRNHDHVSKQDIVDRLMQNSVRHNLRFGYSRRRSIKYD